MKRILLFLVFFTPPILVFAEVPLTLEHARTRAELQIGLSNRSYLPPHHGMLFHLPYCDYWRFWSKECQIPLSIAFLDKEGTILDIQELLLDGPIVEAQKPCHYALEMASHWFDNQQVMIGDRIVWDEKSGTGKVVFFKKMIESR